MKSEDDRQAAKGTGRRRLKVAGEVLIFLFYLLVLDQVIYRLPVEPVTIQHPDGWLEHAWTPPVSWEDKKAYWRRVYREEVLLDYEIRGAPDLAFRRFLELAGENGIPVKLLNMPVTAEQMEFFTRGEYDAYIDYITRTADELRRRVHRLQHAREAGAAGMVPRHASPEHARRRGFFRHRRGRRRGAVLRGG